METLRVVLASDWYLPRKGGVETAIYNLAKSLSEIGHEPIVLTHQNKDLPDPPLLDYNDGFPVVRLKVPLDGDDYTTSYKAAVLLFDFIKHNGPHIIHGHSLVSPFAILAIHGGKGILGIPTVLTHHSLIARELNYRRKRMAKYAVKRADILTAVSSIVKRDLEEITNEKYKVYLTPNCVRLEEWGRTDRMYDGDPVISFISRLTERKNPLLVIEAFKSILKQAPQARLYIAGWGPLEQKVLEEIRKKELKGKAIFLGSLEKPQVRALLASSDLFLMPGRREAFSIATLEALALGVPVVGFGNTGLEDIVTHGENGYLAYNIDEFIRYSVAIVSDYQLRKAMSAKARVSAEKFDCRKVVLEYIDVYRRAMEMCSNERRLLVYKLYRIVRGNPVRRGEWCYGKRLEYYKVPPKRSGVPHIRH
ncbi:MAG: glycosyltransferase family 4 protein [Desulfurococcales archaeon]|nr:glycosyltransferase family 4 protein [Desulfurococcales archaeon]